MQCSRHRNKNDSSRSWSEGTTAIQLEVATRAPGCKAAAPIMQHDPTTDASASATIQARPSPACRSNAPMYLSIHGINLLARASKPPGSCSMPGSTPGSMRPASAKAGAADAGDLNLVPHIQLKSPRAPGHVQASWRHAKGARGRNMGLVISRRLAAPL